MDDGPRPFPNHPGGRPTGSLPICIPRVPQEAYRGDGESFFLCHCCFTPSRFLLKICSTCSSLDFLPYKRRRYHQPGSIITVHSGTSSFLPSRRTTMLAPGNLFSASWTTSHQVMGPPLKSPSLNLTSSMFKRQRMFPGRRCNSTSSNWIPLSTKNNKKAPTQVLLWYSIPPKCQICPLALQTQQRIAAPPP